MGFPSINANGDRLDGSYLTGGFFGSRSAMAAPAVEDLVYCLDAAQHFVAVLCQLCRLRRNAMNSLVAKTIGLGTSIGASQGECCRLKEWWRRGGAGQPFNCDHQCSLSFP